MNYLIENKIAKIYIDSQESPWVIQPHWPNGIEFANDQEAETWALQFIEMQTVPESLMPQDGPNEIRRSKPTEKDIRKARLEASGLSIDDIKEIVADIIAQNNSI